MDFIETYMKYLFKLDKSYLPSEEILKDKLSKHPLSYRLDYIKSLELGDEYLPPTEELKKYLDGLILPERISTINRNGLSKRFLPRRNKIKEYLLDKDNIKKFEKEFYNKAHILYNGDDIITLRSYFTDVAKYNLKTKKLKINGWYSDTTSRHINTFIDYIGGDRRLSKSELEGSPTLNI